MQSAADQLIHRAGLNSGHEVPTMFLNDFGYTVRGAKCGSDSVQSVVIVLVVTGLSLFEVAGGSI